MSMSGSERPEEDQNTDASLQLRQEFELPEDFTEEDLAFAQEIDALFPLTEEEIPPYYAQTLLAAEDPRLQPAANGLEYKTRAKVFHRLKLHRSLFRQSPAVAKMFMGRPLVAFLAACLIFMLFTVIATGPSFASGLEVLLSGKHSGVFMVHSYPNVSKTHSQSLFLADAAAPSSSEQITLSEAQQQLHFTMYRPQVVPNNYELHSFYLYENVDQDWSDGPMLEMDYSYARPGENARGTGQISICEFKPKGQVLQVVQLGAARYVQIDGDGRASAIYVDGQWVRINKFSHTWLYGTRSEIIYEQDNVIFWIVGDQRDGIDQKALAGIAGSLQPFDARAVHMGGHINEVTVSIDDSTIWPFADDVVYTVGPNGSSLSIVGTETPSPDVRWPVDEAPVQGGGR